jgi:hypothetical protein
LKTPTNSFHADAFRRSLYCLSRPLPLLAIALLLLNDHVLKQAVGAWWTGKLSDFAGLAFFPFVLAAALGLLLDRRGWPARRSGRLAFALTALWFILLKTNPAANAATATLWARLNGGPAHVVMDPADLVALLVLWPAWQLWQREQPGPHPAAAQRLHWPGLLALAVAALATAATSCDYFPPVFQQVAQRDGVFYLVSGEAAGSAPAEVHRYDVSGRGWQALSEQEAAALEIQPASPSLPAEACLPAGPCYRVDGDERVYRSGDGGRSWRVAWRIPPGRRAFMEHLPGAFAMCVPPVDVGPYDVAVAGTAGAHTVVVAMGNQGALVRHPGGAWERQQVGKAAPLPFAAKDLGTIVNVLLLEGFFALLALIAVLWLLYIFAWFRSAQEWLRPSKVSVVLLLLLVAVAWLVPESLFYLWWLLPVVLAPWLFLLSLIRYVRLGRGDLAHEARRWWLLAVAALPAGFLFLVLWVVGVIGHYPIALIAGVATAGVLLAIAAPRAVRLTSAARKGRHEE